MTPAGTVVQPVGIGSFLGDTIGHAVKALVLHVAEAGLHAIGATARAMLDSPPSVTDMRSGLMADAEQLGHVTGWVAAALSGHTVTADPSVATAPAPGQPGTVQAAAGGGCGACPGQAAPAVVTAPGRATGGAVAAARAVLAAGRDWDPATAVAVAGAESSWRPDARNASSASGLFQMKYPMHKALFGGAPWSDPYANARAAHALWRTNGWSQPWVTYRKGTYLKFMPAARAAVAQAGGFVTRPAPAARPRTAQVSFTTGTSAGVMVDGHKVSPVAARQLRLAEKLGGINLTVMQGGYGGSHVAASGTSHNYPGVVDVSPGTVGVERLLRQVGFAAWARNIPGRSSIGSGAHVHAVSLLDAGDAKAPQVVGSWARHGNGLGGNTDPAPHYAWVPNLAAQVGATALGSPGGATVTAISCADPPRAPAAKPKPPVAPKAPAPAPRAPRKSPGPPTAQAAA